MSEGKGIILNYFNSFFKQKNRQENKDLKKDESGILQNRYLLGKEEEAASKPRQKAAMREKETQEGGARSHLRGFLHSPCGF